MRNLRKLIGKVIIVPLRGEGYVTGLITNQKNSILLGHFFDRVYQTPPKNIDEWSPSPICLICLFGILGIKNQQWKILGDMPCYKKEEWPVPAFKQQDILNPEEYYSIVYEDNLKNYKKIRAAKEDVMQLYPYGIMGYGAVEIKLSKLLRK